MGQEEAIDAILSVFGLNRLESEIYMFLARHGVLKCRDISKGMKRHTAQVYRALKTLQAKGLVESTLEAPSRFSAVPFERIIDLSIKIKQDEATAIERERNRVLDYWKHIGQPVGVLSTERFVVIEGRSQIYSRVSQMIKESTKRFSVISTIQGIVQADQFGSFDVGSKPPMKSPLELRVLTELTFEGKNQAQSLLDNIAKLGLRVTVRKPNIEKLPPSLAIKDESEILFFVSSTNEGSKQTNDVCLWTNCKALVQAFSNIFETSWRNSIDLNKKLVKPGSPIADVQVVRDPLLVSKRFQNAFDSAKDKLVILTSAEGLHELFHDKERLEKAVRDGKSVKIMAPVTQENLEVAIELTRLCEVKHVSANYYVETITVDDSVVLQFTHKGVGSAKKLECFTSSCNLEYASLIEHGLSDIWNRSTYPSANTLDELMPYGPSLFQFSDNSSQFFSWPIIDVAPPSLVSEEIIANKCLNAKKIVCKNPIVDISRAYGSLGIALIHPPEYLNLPDIIIQCSKIDEQSSFGAEDWLTVSLADDEKKDKRYHLVATVGDNPNSRALVEAIYSGANIQTVNQDEIQIRVHGNTLFAAWTFPITLIPNRYELPPACLVIEGNGQVKTRALTVKAPSGFRHELEQNYFSAFITFIHRDNQYTGPSTDGCFCRDFVTTNYPPRTR